MSTPMNYPVHEGHPLQASARGWQQLQVGVLGFVGVCGLFSGDASAARPPWLQDISGGVAVTGLVASLIAVVVIASVAHPFSARPMTVAAAARRLRSGIIITFVAVALTALAALSWWWPQHRETADPPAPPQRVAVATATGSACGDLVESGSGAIVLDTDGKQVRVPLSRLSSIEVVDKC
jgi:hypothetical protein